MIKEKDYKTFFLKIHNIRKFTMKIKKNIFLFVFIPILNRNKLLIILIIIIKKLRK